MSDLVTQVYGYIIRHHLIDPGETVIVAVSGGADSLVLLHVLCALRDSLDMRLHVATLDHGIRGEASVADVAFVRAIAAAWGVPVSARSVDVPAYAGHAGNGIEAAARQLRYAFLADVAGSVGARKIATGHTQDDQAETVLLHLIRGSGLDGLRGMLPVSPLTIPHPLAPSPPGGEGSRGRGLLFVVRPLLDVSRAAIDAYANAHDLTPRVDATNRDLDYMRNRLRHEIIPLLETLNPNLKAVLARAADILRADADLIAQVGQDALARVMAESRGNAVILDRVRWWTLYLAEKRAVIRAAVQKVQPGMRDLAFEHVEAAIRVADQGQTGAAATLPGGLMLRVDHAALILAPADSAVIAADAPAIPPGDPALFFAAGDSVRRAFGEWMFEAYTIPADADLAALHDDPVAAALAIPPGTRLMLRTRQAGDRFMPRGMGGNSQKLADTLTNMHVPAAWRDRIPLLVAQAAGQDRIAWFVAPTSTGVRGRVAAWCAISAMRPQHDPVLVVRWSH